MNGVALWLGVGVLGGAGALLRFLVDTTAVMRWGRRLPWGTAIVNLTGSFALGVLSGLAVGRGVALLLGVALVGSYTTFSTWMVETLALAEAGRRRAVFVNAVILAVAGLGAAAAGWALGGGALR